MNELLRDRLINAYYDLIPLVILNVLWFIVSIPLVTLIPATGALFYSTNLMAHGKSAGWREFFAGFRICFWRSWIWGVINLFIVLGLSLNYLFYPVNWLHVLVIVVAILWLMIQIYHFPLLLEQEQPSIGLGLRNSLVLIAKRPLFAVGATFVIGGLIVATTVLLWPAWMALTASICAYLANMATLDSIAKVGSRPTPPDESAEESA